MGSHRSTKEEVIDALKKAGFNAVADERTYGDGIVVNLDNGY